MCKANYRTFSFIFIISLIQGSSEESNAVNSVKPTIRLGFPAHIINGEHISLEFYAASESGDLAKNNLQSLLQNFLENLQRNLSTSAILNTEVAKPADIEINRYQLSKLNYLANYFEHSSETAGQFALKAEHFFEVSKNESYSLLMKLRHVPSAQRFLPTAIKMRLTDYFAEMEFFHVMFSEVIDEALEYTIDILRSIQRTFLNYADIQREILRNFNSDEWCCSAYMDFLQQWSAEIFKCAAGVDLSIAYDVYATSETFSKYIMRQLEFRIQRLYNCFIFSSYQMRCNFLRKPEQDFEKLFAKLDELQQYFDIKIKKGRVNINRTRRRRQNGFHDKCIPNGFPDNQMKSSLKMCFYFPNLN